MKRMTLAIVVLALITGGAHFVMADPDPDPTMGALPANSMSVAELEKAADKARSEKDYVTAIDFLRAAIKKDRNNAVLYNKLGISELHRRMASLMHICCARALKAKLDDDVPATDADRRDAWAWRDVIVF